jgi:dTDP-4-dehydrorhamnose reductase
MPSVIERVAVIGASGQLGTDLMREFSDVGPIALEHRVVDLEEPSSVLQALRNAKPTLLINTAAYHNVELCESFPQRAFAVNALGVDTLASICAAHGIVFAHISTDYVFSGTSDRPYGEADEANPINVYGCSKRAGEQLMSRHAREQYIFRTSGLFGTAQSSKGPNFVERILRSAESGMPLRVVDDVTMSPSFTQHVAAGVRRIVENAPYGLYHVSNSGACTWYDLAVEAIHSSGMQRDVERIQSPTETTPRRPRMSALRHDAITAAGLTDLPDWRDAVAEYVARRTATA